MKNKIGQKIDLYYDVRERKRELNQEIKKLEEMLAALKDELISIMELEGLQKASGEKATASLVARAYPAVEDWETFLAWAVKNERYDMVQRRVNEAPFREFLELQNLTPPGLNTYIETRLNLRRR